MPDERAAPRWGALTLRRATQADAAALLEVYAPFVNGSAVSFEAIVPTEAEFAARIRSANEGWVWLVAEEGGECLGYAYGSAHRARAAYRWSTEVSAYLGPRARGRGVGRALYTQLFGDLAALGYCQAFAGITLPNDASVAFHRAMGFQPIGVFHRVGRKFGVWHDVAWLQRELRDSPPEG